MRESQSEALAASASYFMASVCLSLTNKAVFSRDDFDFPLSVLASQALVTVTLLFAGSQMRLSPAVHFDAQLARRMAPITLLFVSMLWTSSKALRYCSVPVVTIFKNLSVVAITVYERAVYSDRSSVGVVLSLMCMLAGSLVAGAGDLQFSSVGYSWMLLNVICTVCHLAAVRAWLRHTASSTAKTFHNQLFALGIFAVAAVMDGEWRPYGPSQLPAFPSRLAAMPHSFQAGFLLSTVLGLLINIASFWALQVTSGTTYSFVGASNKIPSAVLGHFLFSSDLTTLGWLGVIFGLASGLGFAVSKYQLQQEAQAQKSPSRACNRVQPSPSGGSGETLEALERGALLPGGNNGSIGAARDRRYSTS